MRLEDLKAEYDKLQIKYGTKELTSIYNGEWKIRRFLVYENVENMVL